MADEYKHAIASPPGRARVADRHHSHQHKSASEAGESAKAKRAAAIRQLHQHLTEQGPRYRRRNVLEDGESSESGSSISNGNDVDDDNNYYHGRAADGHKRDVDEDGVVDDDDDDSVSVLSMFTKKYEDIAGPNNYGHEEDSGSESSTPRWPPRRISVITKRKSVEKNDAAEKEYDGLSDESEEEKEVDDSHAKQRRQRKGFAGFLKLAHEDDPRQGSAGYLSYDEIIGNEQFPVPPHSDLDANEQHKTSGVLVDFQAKVDERLPRRRRRRSYQEEDDNDNEDDKEVDHDRDTAKELKELEEELALLRKHRTMRSGRQYQTDDSVEETKQNDKLQSPATMKWESTRGQSGLARRRATRCSSRQSRDSSNERSGILNAFLHGSNISAGGSESDFFGGQNASSGNLSTGELSGDITAGLEELRRRMAAANIKTKQDPSSASASEDQPGSNTACRGSITRRGRRRSSDIIRCLSSGLNAECSGDEMEDAGLSGPLKGRVSKKLMDSLQGLDNGDEEALEIKSVGEIMEDFPQASYEVYDLKGSDDEDGPRCQPRRSSRRRSSMAESDGESINSRSSMTSNAFSAVLSLAEELMVTSDDLPLDARCVDLPTMPGKTQLRRNRSVASASSVGPDIADRKHQKRRSSFDAGALGDLLVGKSNYLKAVEMEEEAVHGGLGQEDFHASMLLWDANRSSKDNASNEPKKGQRKDRGHHFSGYLNDCFPEMEEDLKIADVSLDLADKSARSLQRAKSADAFPSKRRKSRRRQSKDTSSVHSVGSLNTSESLDFSALAAKSMQTEEYEEASADVTGRPRKSILKHMSSLSLESLDIESRVIELDLNDDLANETASKNERSVNKRRSAQPRSSISSIPSVVLDALGDEVNAEDEVENANNKVVKTAIRSSGQRASSRASISSIPSVVLSALENEVDGDTDLEDDAQDDVAVGDDVPTNPSSRSRPHRLRSSSFASVPSAVLDTLQSELGAEGAIDEQLERIGNRDDSSKIHLSKPSSLRELQPPPDPAEASRQPSEDSSPEVETETKIKRKVTRKGSLNALLGLLPNLEDELDEEVDGISPPPTKPRGGREIRKALSFDKLKALMNDSLDPDDNGVNNNNSNSTFGSFDKPNRPRERSSSLGRLKDIMGDLVGDDSNSSLPKAPLAAPTNKGMLACMDSTRAFDYDHESSIMQAMGREAPAHYNARAVAENEERRRKLSSAGKAGFGGMFHSIMANLGSEEAD